MAPAPCTHTLWDYPQEQPSFVFWLNVVAMLQRTCLRLDLLVCWEKHVSEKYFVQNAINPPAVESHSRKLRASDAVRRVIASALINDCFIGDGSVTTTQQAAGFFGQEYTWAVLEQMIAHEKPSLNSLA